MAPFNRDFHTSNKQHAFQKSPSKKKRPAMDTIPGYLQPSQQRPMDQTTRYGRHGHVKVGPADWPPPKTIEMKPATEGRFHYGRGILFLVAFIWMAYSVWLDMSKDEYDDTDGGIELLEVTNQSDRNDKKEGDRVEERLFDSLDAGEWDSEETIWSHDEEENTSSAPF